ncbi:MAG: hypothetical protein AAFP83_23990, partial [Bacteroidota bacterium]
AHRLLPMRLSILPHSALSYSCIRGSQITPHATLHTSPLGSFLFVHSWLILLYFIHYLLIRIFVDNTSIKDKYNTIKPYP